MFLLPHYPATPSYLAGFQIKGGFSDEKKKKIQRKHFIFESWVSLRSPGSGYTTPGSRAGGQLPHYPAVRAHWPPFPRLSRAPPPRRVLVSDPGVGAGGGVVQPRPREVASLVSFDPPYFDQFVQSLKILIFGFASYMIGN